MRLTSYFHTHRFHPSLWPTLGMVVLVASTLALGNWQRHRATEKRALAEQQAVASQQPPIELTGSETDAAALVYRKVQAHGEYDAAHALLIDNKVHAGRAGFHAVVPFKIAANSRYVLVDRGWIAQGARRSELPSPPVPAGAVIVAGRANLPPQRYLELGHESSAGPVWQNLDIERIAAATGLPLLPFIVEESESSTRADGLVRDWPAPDFGIDQHVSYMIQWYSLAALAVVLWLVLNWRRRDAANGGSRQKT